MSNPRGKINKDSAKDLIGLLAVLGLIAAGMIAFNSTFRDRQGDADKEWYYKRIAPPTSRAAPPSNKNP